MAKRTPLNVARCAATAMAGMLGLAAWGHEQPPHGACPPSTMTGMHGAPGAALSFADLQATVASLNRARTSTEKYQDVRIAKMAGYRAVGPYVRGMGFHYVNLREAGGAFEIERPPILLYEKDDSAPEGLHLVGVSYLFAALTGSDGQPVNTPFPGVLAAWHKHHDICLFADGDVRLKANNADCQERGGRFIAETDWMIHAWIWKDSPAGVFSPTNHDIR